MRSLPPSVPKRLNKKLRALWKRVAKEVRAEPVPRTFGGTLSRTIWSEADVRQRFIAALNGLILQDDIHVEATGPWDGRIDLVLAPACDCRCATDPKQLMNVKPYAFIEFALIQDIGPPASYGKPKLEKLSRNLAALRKSYKGALGIAAIIVRGAGELPEASDPNFWVELIPWGAT